MSAAPHFSQEEDCLIRTMFAEGRDDGEITLAINSVLGTGRSRHAILRRRNKLGMRLRDAKVPISPKPRTLTPEHQERIQADYRFKLAMLSALARGQERVVKGVIKDHRPFALKTIHTTPAHSCCGSAAAQCMET